MKSKLFIVFTVDEVKECGIWNKSIKFMDIYKGLCKTTMALSLIRVFYIIAGGSKLGHIGIIAFLVIHFVPTITQLDKYIHYGNIF